MPVRKHGQRGNMKSISDFIVKFRYIFFMLFIACTIICAILVIPVYKKVNYDLTSYLPTENFNTNDGYRFLSKNFNVQADLEIGVSTNDEKAVILANKFEKVDGVSSVVWINSFNDIKKFGTLSDDKLFEIQNLFKKQNPKNNNLYDFEFLITLENPPSSMESLATHKEISKILKNTTGSNSYYISGMTETANQLFESSFNEIYIYCIVAGIIVLFILLISTSSIFEPIILISTLIVSIIINLGTNIIFPSTSIITFACSAILQLGLSMDYAIFMMHSYKEKLKTYGIPQIAAKKAIPESAKSIFASALTTIGGLLALLTMKFSIGMDLGLVLSKGIIMSFATVIFLQPCLMIFLEKARSKTLHRSINLKFKNASKFSIKHRNVVAIIFLVLIIPMFFVQKDTLDFGYVKFMKPTNTNEQRQVMTEKMANQVMIAVPCKSGNVDQQYEFVEKLEKFKDEDMLSFSLGLFCMVDKDSEIDYNGLTISGDFALQMMLSLMEYQNTSKTATASNTNDEQSKFSSMLKQYVNNGYTIYTVGLNPNMDIESQESFDALKKIQTSAENIFCERDQNGNAITKDEKGNKIIYMTGMTQAAADFAAITPQDFKIVTIVSILIIFAILLLTFRSFKYSGILVALIELGIWINLAMQHIFSNGTINFMTYLIIGAVQLGACVDYAILYTNNYLNFRKKWPANQSAYLACSKSAMSILTSALIMAGACLSVFFVSSNLVIKEITFMMARGSLISLVLVLFVLPALLICVDHKKSSHFRRTLKVVYRKPKINFLKKQKKPDPENLST